MGGFYRLGDLFGITMICTWFPRLLLRVGGGPFLPHYFVRKVYSDGWEFGQIVHPISAIIADPIM